MGRRKSNVGKDLMEIGAALPWWFSLILAFGTYFLFHNLAAVETGAGSSKDVGPVLSRTVFKTIAMYAQYAVPVLLLLGATGAFFKRKQRASLFDSVTRGQDRDRLDALSWQQFEHLTHEYFHRQGYEVTETRKGADGGIDLKLRKNGTSASVQCKHWRNKKVGVSVVCEQFGIMAAEGIGEGFVVTSGQFTDDAFAFANGKPLYLIDGEELRQHLGIVARDHVEVRKVYPEPLLACPRCGSEMKLRTARKRAKAGSEFWGCSRFPKCRGTRQRA